MSRKVKEKEPVRCIAYLSVFNHDRYVESYEKKQLKKITTRKRLQQFFNELTDKHPDENVLVVSHGFTIKLILDLFLNIGNLVNLNEPTNAGITKFILKNGARTLVYFNR